MHTLRERLDLLGERYALLAAPLLLPTGIGPSSAAVLGWTATTLLALCSVNALDYALRRKRQSAG